ncbi:MAG: DUF5723 family protein [Bacteroidota bacterium]
MKILQIGKLNMLLILLLGGELLSAQVPTSLYFMRGVPQSNWINPAYQPDCKLYLGIPVAAPLRFDLTSGTLAYDDVIFKSATMDSLITFLHPEADKQAFLDKLKPVNHLSTEVGFTLASFGFKANKSFFSFYLTPRIEADITYPGDLARMLINGPDTAGSFDLQGTGVNMAVFTEASLGWSRKFGDKLSVGVRGKILFGIAGLNTKSSAINLTTSDSLWSIRSDMQVSMATPFTSQDMIGSTFLLSDVLSGMGDAFDQMAFDIPWDFINFENLGFALDLGVDFRPIPQLQLSASALDLGYMNWSRNTVNMNIEGQYDFRGLEVIPFQSVDTMMFQNMADSLAGFVTGDIGEPFSYRLHPKIMVGAAFYPIPKISIGLMSRTDLLEDGLRQKFTATANLTTGRFINLTFTYSYYLGYMKNLGAGFSFNVGPLNLYLISDNIGNNLLWPQEAQSVNLWFGMNLCFGYRQPKVQKAVEYKDKPLI